MLGADTAKRMARRRAITDAVALHVAMKRAAAKKIVEKGGPAIARWRKTAAATGSALQKIERMASAVEFGEAVLHISRLRYARTRSATAPNWCTFPVRLILADPLDPFAGGSNVSFMPSGGCCIVSSGCVTHGGCWLF
jgi:hypothetical protein